MSNTDKLREIARKHFPIDKDVKNNTIYNQIQQSKQDSLLSDLTALISEHYYPKEFVEWMIAKAPHDTVYKTFGHVTANMEWITFNSLDELFNYWKENEQ